MMASVSVGRVARLHGPLDLRLHDERASDAGPDDVRLRVTAVGLCGSDRHWYLEAAIGDTAMEAPAVLGHEFTAVVVGGPRDGERVAVDPAAPCGGCEWCRSGRGHLCPTLRFAGSAPTDGALRTWMAWPAARCLPLPDAIADEEATMLEVLGIALHAIDLARVRPGMTAGVYGSGPIGLVLIRALRAAGIEHVVATDRLASRVEAARRSGADTAVQVVDGRDPAATIPVDVAFECSGDDAALDTAVRAVRAAGRVLLVGIPEGDRSTLPASPTRRKELTLQLVRRMAEPDLGRAIALVASGAVRLDGLVTHRFGLEAVSEAFAMLVSRNGLKVVVVPEART